MISRVVLANLPCKIGGYCVTKLERNAIVKPINKLPIANASFL